ncbi:hypothetical protein M409DRAFT_70226 [Zasmidium cellare ATCC 36951]|uniref:BAR domain-containing protein n=1 Tax=Zasmidium cellare ATCC 36951 TaxID=1080233 RepID=A0A6A6C1E3_ZASCE|nr:uncharacterized protein M409DRAFT_70226 [Zasmidium cellare ATCC 36951]KAF2160683.1 hypothetical protein M409DRAFT_70226 [Zasmidium cellare ATCC 36951]
MNVNKKLDRLKQWGKERMGGEVKTETTDEFKSLEMEMQLRHDGMDRLKKSADAYILHTSKREKYQDKEQQLPVGYFGSMMVAHGDDFEPDSEFGQCLSTLGRANERIARMQETYCANATSSWLESLERSLVQMKEYQRARKQLDTRRLAYDTAAIKMQKSKKEDFRMEEELRQQKMKYEESSEDVYRRMLDIKEAEVESVQDLTSFLEAELTYYDRCRELLLQVKRDWPAQAMTNRSGTASPVNGGMMRRQTRSRASSMNDRFGRIDEDEPLEPPPRPTISSRVPSGANSPRKELPGFDLPVRINNTRSTSTPGFEGPTQLRADSPAGMPRLARVPTEPSHLLGARSNLRITKSREAQAHGGSDVFGDDQSEYSDSPSTAFDEHHRAPSWSTMGQDGGSQAAVKKAPPPPPPSRAKKPPPPPPMKRSALSTSEVPHY